MIKPEISEDLFKKAMNVWDIKMYVDQLARRDMYEAFAVGDTVTRCWTRKDNDKVVKTFETYNNTNEPVKYLIVHRDERGITFARRVCVTGKLGKEVLCLEIMRDVMFEMESRAIDHALLGEEYHPEDSINEMEKRKRELRAANKKNSVKFKTLKEIEKWITDNLQVGTTFYTVWGSDSLAGCDEYTVKKITLKGQLEKKDENWRDPDKRYREEGLTTKIRLVADCTTRWGSSHNQSMTACDLLERRLFLTRPKQMKDDQ